MLLLLLLLLLQDALTALAAAAPRRGGGGGGKGGGGGECQFLRDSHLVRHRGNKVRQQFSLQMQLEGERGFFLLSLDAEMLH